MRTPRSTWQDVALLVAGALISAIVGSLFQRPGNDIGNGTWIKRQWRRAQVRAGIRRPIRWHDLRHQFVSVLVAIGKHPRYIAQQARHADPGFSMRKYAHLFDEVVPIPLEWPDDLLWPGGLEWLDAVLAGANWVLNPQEKAGDTERTPAPVGERATAPEPLS